MTGIVFHNVATGWAGTERYLFTLATRLDRSVFAPRILITDLRPDEHAAFRTRFEGAGLPVEVMAGAHRGDFMRCLARSYRYYRALRRRLGDRWILHFNLQTPAGDLVQILGARAAGVPAIVCTNHLPVLGFEGLNAVGRRLALLAYRACDRVIVESQTNRQIAANHGLGTERTLRVVTHGVDVDAFAERGGRDATRAGLGVSPDDVLLGAVGRLVEQKGYRHAVEAVARLQGAVHRRVRLVVAGDGPRLIDLRALADRLGVAECVSFPGAIEDPAQLFSALDVFVLPSEFEGLPLALLEAMAAGLPVVATDVGGVRDAVADGETGVLLARPDAALLADAVAGLIERPQERRRLGDAAREAARERFGVDRMVAETEQVYRDLLDGRK